MAELAVLSSLAGTFGKIEADSPFLALVPGLESMGYLDCSAD